MILQQKLNSSQTEWLKSTAEKLIRKMPYALEKAQSLDGIPYTTKGNEWQAGPFDGICWWTNGFWSGTMWQMLLMTKDERYRIEAQRAETLLDAAFDDFKHLHHDCGFMWRISAAAQFDLLGTERSYDRAMEAAAILAGRFNPLGFIRAWNGGSAGLAIIDCMMNLSLLYWASEKSSDPRFRLIAMRHADTAMKHFVREDGSCNHIVIFDPCTMEIIEKPAGQGYSVGSSWSRGQGWALYGFTISYKYTKNEVYLSTACRVADYFISCIGEDGIPDADFRAPAQPVRKDNIAGALAACGLLDLASYTDGEKSKRYFDAAMHLLQSMETQDADWSLECPAIFRRCLPNYGCGEHMHLQYADYFFIEAINKLRGETYSMW